MATNYHKPSRIFPKSSANPSSVTKLNLNELAKTDILFDQKGEGNLRFTAEPKNVAGVKRKT